MELVLILCKVFVFLGVGNCLVLLLSGLICISVLFCVY